MSTERPFRRVLIANRGAIATRIVRTLERLGIASVAVYAEVDRDSLHVRAATQAVSLGDGPATDTYLDVARLLRIAADTGCDAIHPGYGFLSENADFVRRCETAGIAFIGPRADQIEAFGLKHAARALAERAKVPLLPGSALLSDRREALREAGRIGYPVMLKSTAGGGGIGMQVCRDATALDEAFERVQRLGTAHFSDGRAFLERYVGAARHVEVQVIGDGAGEVLAIGTRDCSAQRRHQKVLEECPAPHLSPTTREALARTAERLLAQVDYRNAGTVEFIVDAEDESFYFLEVNTRLQVEHGVTEAVYGIDLVECMLQVAAGAPPDLDAMRQRLVPHGHAVQVRLYAEDPGQDFRPSPGRLVDVHFPTDDVSVRVDTWVEAGIEVPASFDPLLAKLICHGEDRDAAMHSLRGALRATRLHGTETNLEWLIALADDATVAAGRITTERLRSFDPVLRRIDVLQAGTQSTLQSWPGRTGHWHVGVPPSGPFDSYSHRLLNRLLDNPVEASALEATLDGPTLRFSCRTRIAVGGDAEPRLDGAAMPSWTPVAVEPGQTLQLGRVARSGARLYLAIDGGFDCPAYLGSTATFTLGGFGGHAGRALRSGDVLRNLVDPSTDRAAGLPDELSDTTSATAPVPVGLRPIPSGHDEVRTLRVIYGPHGAPDFFTDADIETFFATVWRVHYQSSRTGVRLIGPKPDWARPDGGEAGLHPSNIHDNAYAFGTVDFTGDMPVILGPDGPSLGGFVCPATVISADLWKLGQLRDGHRLRFVPVSQEDAVALERDQSLALRSLSPIATDWRPAEPVSPIIGRLDVARCGEDVVYRAAGDHFLLVEYGPQEISVRRRFRVHALMDRLTRAHVPGLRELTPGIRSLQIHYDSQRVSRQEVLALLMATETELAGQLEELSVPSRIVHLPLSWDDIACHEAIEKYSQTVRPGAPWCPSNLEFIRRINGLEDVEAVKRIVFDASYLVMGLGDVYLGAPVATPVDPRHRLVTTKYNPARTWTAENSVGIGGSYLCVYGMEGPGGYQFVGRTLQVWNRARSTADFAQPWLLRFFDQIRFHEVTHEELTELRAGFVLGQHALRIEETRFDLAAHERLLDTEAASIERFRTVRQAAFAAELAEWHANDQFEFVSAADAEQQAGTPEAANPLQGCSARACVLESPVTGSLWRLEAALDQRVQAGQPLMILESMKMEIVMHAPVTGRLTKLLVAEGRHVTAGAPLAVLEPEPASDTRSDTAPSALTGDAA